MRSPPWAQRVRSFVHFTPFFLSPQTTPVLPLLLSLPLLPHPSGTNPDRRTIAPSTKRVATDLTDESNKNYTHPFFSLLHTSKNAHLRQGDLCSRRRLLCRRKAQLHHHLHKLVPNLSWTHLGHQRKQQWCINPYSSTLFPPTETAAAP